MVFLLTYKFIPLTREKPGKIMLNGGLTTCKQTLIMSKQLEYGFLYNIMVHYLAGPFNGVS